MNRSELNRQAREFYARYQQLLTDRGLRANTQLEELVVTLRAEGAWNLLEVMTRDPNALAYNPTARLEADVAERLEHWLLTGGQRCPN